MRIINKTAWNTKDIKKLINECYKRYNYVKAKTVIIEYARTRLGYARIHGKASIGLDVWRGFHDRIMRPAIWMYVPPRVTKVRTYKDLVALSEGRYQYEDEIHDFDSEKFAGVFVHEMMHNQGFEHREMKKLAPNEYRAKGQEWAKDFKVRLAPKPEKKKVNIRQVRYERVLKHIEEKERKLKRIKNQLKKYYAKKKYYERTGVKGER